MTHDLCTGYRSRAKFDLKSLHATRMEGKYKARRGPPSISSITPDFERDGRDNAARSNGKPSSTNVDSRFYGSGSTSAAWDVIYRSVSQRDIPFGTK